MEESRWDLLRRGHWAGRDRVEHVSSASISEMQAIGGLRLKKGAIYARRGLCVTYIRGLILTRPYDSRLFRYENSPAAPAV